MSEVLAVVDGCRSNAVNRSDGNADAGVPSVTVTHSLARIREIAEHLREQRQFDRVIYLRENDHLLPGLYRKYTNGLVRATHDSAGHALAAYLAALELPRTRYLLHYDADMLLHQAHGYDWTHTAISLMGAQPSMLAASPRLSPPRPKPSHSPETPAEYEEHPVAPVVGGWRSDWFSTRCFLIDLRRLAGYLPLVPEAHLNQRLLSLYFGYAYPPSPERMLSRRVGRAGGWKLYMADPRAWLLHPEEKSSEFIRLLSGIMDSVHAGVVPDSQRGKPDLDLACWQAFLQERSAIGFRSRSPISDLDTLV